MNDYVFNVINDDQTAGRRAQMDVFVDYERSLFFL